MAITITRTAWTDDDGTGTTGTVINNAQKTSLYDQIDALFAGAFSLVGPLTVTAFGTHAFSAGGTGGNFLQVANTTSGVANKAALVLTAGTANAALYSHSQGFTTSGPDVAAGAKLFSDGAGGISIQAAHASGVIRLYAGGTTERMRIATTGVVTFNAYTAATFVAGDKYLVVDAAGVIHVSAIGPAS